MTPLSRALAWFPALVLTTTALAFLAFCATPSWTRAAAIPAAAYGLPLLAFRVHERWHPVRDGTSTLRGGDYSPWWGAHQIQWVYLAFPSLEAVLRAVPGLYSAWLRAWGADIGRGVYWTPGVVIADRSLLSVGDGVVIGERFSASAHLIKPTRDGADLLLVVKRVRIEAGAFVGAGVVMGPGAIIPAGAFVASGTVIHPGTRFKP